MSERPRPPDPWADPTVYFPPPNPDLIFNASPVQNKHVQVFTHFGVGVDWIRQMPRLNLEEVDSERFVSEQKITSAGSLMAWRAQLGIDLMFSRRWILGIGGIAVGSAIGPSDRVVTAADGSPVEMHPWTTGIVTLVGPGVGIHLHKRRWTVAASSRVALTHMWMHSTVVTGRTTNDAAVLGWIPSLRLDLAICRRVGPQDNACVYVETRAYDTTSFNGGSAGLRWEFGG